MQPDMIEEAKKRRRFCAAFEGVESGVEYLGGEDSYTLSFNGQCHVNCYLFAVLKGLGFASGLDEWLLLLAYLYFLYPL